MMTIDQLVSIGAKHEGSKLIINDSFYIYENQLEYIEYDENFNCLWNSKKGNIYFFDRTDYDTYIGKLYKFAYIRNHKIIRENGRWIVIPGQMKTHHDIPNFNKYIQDVYTDYKDRLIELQNKYIQKISVNNDILKNIYDVDSRIQIQNIKTYTWYLMELNELITNFTEAYLRTSISRNIKSYLPFINKCISVFDKLNKEFMAIDLEPHRDELFYVYLSIDNLIENDNKY